MAKDKQIIGPLDGAFDEVAGSMVQVATNKHSDTNALDAKTALQVATPKQLVLDLGIEVQKEIDGIEMGILENGIPFLTQNGLAKLAGTARNAIAKIAQDWDEQFNNDVLGSDRISFLKEQLFKNGYNEPQLFITIDRAGKSNYAYPDIVCMAILEYFAFESKYKNEIAIANYRRLASYGLQKYIYDALRYTPPDKWKYHHDRVSLLKDSAPPGYFIVFNEVSGLIVDLINASLSVNERTIPDISVGIAWADYWKASNLDKTYGERIQYAHNYPDYYPQSLSNPQPAKAYPDAALPEFRKWFRETYLRTKFPAYILKKAHVLSGGRDEAERIANLYQPKLITEE